MVVNNETTRPSPEQSATNYKVGAKKTGNDGNMWQVHEDINGRHMWKMVRNKNYNLSRSKSKSKKKKERKRVSLNPSLNLGK